MKKNFVMFLFFIISFSFFSFPKATACADDTSIYAKIQYENVYFYSAPNGEEDARLFALPKTYFVKLLGAEGEEFYYAQYGDLFGYIEKTAVKPMQGTPRLPYATTTFRVFSMEGIGLYKKPNIYEQKIALIPYLSDSLTYYGQMQGQELIPEKSSLWFYAKYSQTGTFGYVYSVFCDKLDLPSENQETFPEITGPLFTEKEQAKPLSNVAMTFIIIGVSLPCLIVLYLLIKPTMLTEKLTKPKAKARARGRDYFEFDESDLS